MLRRNNIGTIIESIVIPMTSIESNAAMMTYIGACCITSVFVSALTAAIPATKQWCFTILSILLTASIVSSEPIVSLYVTSMSWLFASLLLNASYTSSGIASLGNVESAIVPYQMTSLTPLRSSMSSARVSMS